MRAAFVAIASSLALVDAGTIMSCPAILGPAVPFPSLDLIQSLDGFLR